MAIWRKATGGRAITISGCTGGSRLKPPRTPCRRSSRRRSRRTTSSGTTRPKPSSARFSGCASTGSSRTSRRRSAPKNGAAGQTHLSLDFPAAEEELGQREASTPRACGSVAADLDRFFHDETVRALFARTVDAMRERLRTRGQARHFRVFERHDLRPSSRRELCRRGEGTRPVDAQVTNYLHAARRRFRELALAQLRSPRRHRRGIPARGARALRRRSRAMTWISERRRRSPSRDVATWPELPGDRYVHRAADRPRRHGRRVRGARHAARSRRRDQSLERARRRNGTRRAAARGSAGARAARAPGHRARCTTPACSPTAGCSM